MVKEGYKETEIGFIPDDWEVKKLGELSSIKRGASPRPISDKKWFSDKKDIGWIRISDVTSSKKYIKSTAQYLSEEGVKKSRPVYKGDIIMSICASIGVPIILDMNACIHDGFIVYSNLNEKKLNKDYLFYFIEKMQNLFKGKGQTGTQANINTDLVSNTFIPLPPIKEQQSIADILSTADAHIEHLNKLIEDYQLLKKGMMKKLLTEGIGHTEFKETEIGRMPKTWNITFLSQVADVKGGKRLPKGYSLQDEPNGYPYIRVADMYFGGVDQSEIKYVPIDAVDSINNYRISKADIFITVAGTLGIVGTIPESLHNANLTENADKICNIKCNKDYLVYYLQSDNIQNAITKEMTIGAQPKLALTRIKKFIIAVPSVEEQKEIVEIIRAIDERTAEIVFEHQDFMQLKKGLMERLLTGKIRTTELKPMEG